MEDFRTAGVPGFVAATIESLQTDEQVRVNDMLLDAPEGMGMDQLVDHPLNQEGLPRKPLSRAPELGEHSREVLAELGLSDAEIDQLADDGVI